MKRLTHEELIGLPPLPPRNYPEEFGAQWGYGALSIQELGVERFDSQLTIIVNTVAEHPEYIEQYG
jgi:hypothetical protein